MAGILLHAPRDFTNVCVIARTVEAFGVASCYVVDTHRLIRPHYGKSYARRLRNVSAGAFDKVEWRTVADPVAFLGSHAGRRIAVSSAPGAASVYELTLRSDDLYVFGSERDGIPPDIIAACDVECTIPTSGETLSLNLAVAVGIVLGEYIRQVGPAGPDRVARDARLPQTDLGDVGPGVAADEGGAP
jgi:tRNA (cytidine/uridine-2'-O-)-methyltransferase